MKMPSIVSAARILLRLSARAAALSAMVPNVHVARVGPRTWQSPASELPASPWQALVGRRRCRCEPFERSETITPSRKVTTRSAYAATSGSWVTTITVSPCSRLSRLMISMISAEFFESRFPVGSSASRIAGSVDQRARDRDALLLAAGELIRMVVFAPLEPEHFEQSLRRAARHRRVQRRVKQRQLDVLERAGAREQVEALKDEADSTAADRRQLRLASARRRRRLRAGSGRWSADRGIR